MSGPAPDDSADRLSKTGKTTVSRTAAAAGDKRVRRRDAEVLAAATKVFYEKSYADASVQDVADELGILKGSLYHYIKTKEDLLDWLVQGVHDDVEVILKRVEAEKGLEPLERIESLIRKQVIYNVKNLARITVYHHDSDQLSAEPREALRARQRANEQVLITLIEQAQERGEVPADADPRLLANCIFATMIWVYRWYKPGGRFTMNAVADACVAFAMSGLRQGVVPPPAG